MDKVVAKCGAIHDGLSPHCTEESIDLAIPMPEKSTDKIGESGHKVPDKFSDDFMRSKGAN
jgi:hypothetical protein